MDKEHFAIFSSIPDQVLGPETIPALRKQLYPLPPIVFSLLFFFPKILNNK